MENVALYIGEVQFANWQSIEITLGLDVVDTIALSAPFEADRKEFRALFRPLSYPTIQTTLDGTPLFTGTLIDILPDVSAESRTVECSGYSLPGVLDDCTPPASALPLEWRGVGLKAIAEATCAPFGLDVDFRLENDPPFEKVALDPLGQTKESRDKKAIREEGTPWAFLTTLAQQRNAVLSSTAEGRLLIWQAETGRPIAKLEGGAPPLVRVRPTFNPQDYFSEVTCFSPKTRKKKGSKHTASNMLLTGVVRPHCFRADDSEDADAPEAAKAKLGRMCANAVGFTIESIPTWRNPQGQLWQPNTTIQLLAPDAMVYELTDMLIRAVTLRQEKDSETADLVVVFPGAFSGEMPSRFPWS
jgi:prophage tail gpP-like protein